MKTVLLHGSFAALVSLHIMELLSVKHDISSANESLFTPIWEILHNFVPDQERKELSIEQANNLLINVQKSMKTLFGSSCFTQSLFARIDALPEELTVLLLEPPITAGLVDLLKELPNFQLFSVKLVHPNGVHRPGFIDDTIPDRPDFVFHPKDDQIAYNEELLRLTEAVAQFCQTEEPPKHVVQ